MITLSRTTDKLQAFLAAAAATTNPTVQVVFHTLSSQQKADTSLYPADRQYTVLSGTTETDICAGPDQQGKTRHIDYINIYNADTDNITVSVVVDDNGTNRILRKAVLSPGQTLFWTPEFGWQIANDSLVSGWTAGTEIASTSGTAINFTGIPSWVRAVVIGFEGVSTSGTSNIIVQLGDSEGIETTGYVSNACGATSAGVLGSTTTVTSGLTITAVGVAAATWHGEMTIMNKDPAGFTWVGSGTVINSTATHVYTFAGSKSLTATLDRIRITTVNGTDTFDAGSINILYQ